MTQEALFELDEVSSHGKWVGDRIETEVGSFAILDTTIDPEEIDLTNPELIIDLSLTNRIARINEAGIIEG